MAAVAAADAARGGGGNSSGSQQRQRRQQRERAAGAQRERMYIFLQIHFLRSFLRSPHTDRIPDGLPGKVPAEE
jgi:hypothetical protein